MKSRLRFGASFSPEYLEELGDTNPIKALQVIVEELGIQDIRLGLRWNRTVNDAGSVSLDFYRPYLDYLLNKGCRLCLNLGPIKVFRWPEVHVPEQIRENLVSTVTPDTQLASRSYSHLERLLSQLSLEYGTKLDSSCFQLENEAFNPFGEPLLRFSESYLIEESRILKRYFPNASLLHNSNGRRDLIAITEHFKKLTTDPGYSGQALILGLNFYFKYPGIPKGISRYNPLAPDPDHPGMLSIRELLQIRRSMGFSLEISEGQFEPWGKYDTPGNSYADFRYLIETSLDYFPENYPYKLVRLWGVEQLAQRILKGRLNKEHERIIHALNSL